MSLRFAQFALRCQRAGLVARPQRSLKHLYSRRNLSSETATKNETSLEATSSDASSTSNLDSVVRHGQGDGVICLDVGGKHFYTLRSTVAENPVLTDIVACAEANNELTGSGHAVFVDRDPKHFHVILTYLRNKSEDLSYSNKMSFKQKRHHVQLPKDKSHLADLYVEASYFQIEPLKDALCNQSIFALAARSIGGGGGNPFQAVSEAVKTARRLAMGLVGLGGSVSLGNTFGNLKLPAFLTPENSNDDAQTKEKEPPKDPTAPTPALA